MMTSMAADSATPGPASPGPAIPDPAISVSGLDKSFGPTRALRDLSMTVPSGEVHGFLGPNGAGKSTTIRVLLGLVRADLGDVSVLGGDPWTDAVPLHRRLAYVPGDVSLWPNLTGGEAIDLFARLRGGLDRARRDELCERFDLDPTKKGRTYSKGNRQKVAIIAALASDVELLILDEPTAGLDPLMETVFAEQILQARAAGVTVLLSSHTLAQVEALCDRVSIIRQGRIVESGTLHELRHLTRTTVTAETVRPASGLGALPGVHDLKATDGALTNGEVGDGDVTNGGATEGKVQFDVDSEHLDTVVGYLHELGIRSLVSHPPTLEQLFLRHYGEDLAATRSAS